MSEIIPSIEFKQFQSMEPEAIAQLKSVEVLSDGQHIFTAIIPHGDYASKDYAKVQAEYLGRKSNITGGIDPQNIIVTVDADANKCKFCGKTCKNAAGKSAHERNCKNNPKK
jgi:hypothetical protein